MDKSMYLEKNISQQPAIDLLRSMGYTYITPEDCEVQFTGVCGQCRRETMRASAQK